MSLIAEVAEAWVTLIPSLRGAKGTIQKELDGEMQAAGKSGGGKFSGALGGVLTKGSLAVGVAAGAVLGTALFKGFERLSAIDQATAKLTGLGNTTKTVDTIMANALASVEGTAFGLGDAATVAASVVAAGVKPGEDLERTLGLVGDAATIAGVDMGSMGSIFNKVAASGKVQGDVFNQLADAGIPIVQMLAKEMGVTAEQVVALGSAGKIGFEDFQNAMEAGLGGAALESGKTFSGALANVGASLGRLGAALLSGLFPIAVKVFGGIIGFLDKLTKSVVPVADAFAAKLPGAFDAVSGALKSLTSGGGGALKPLIEAFKGFVSSVGTAAVTIGPALASIVKGLAPIAKLAIGIVVVALTAAFNLLGPAVEGASTGFAAVTNFVKDNQTTFKIIAGIITAVLVPAFVLMGVQATIAAAKSVAAWIANSAGAATSAVLSVVGMTLIAAGWVMVGAQALLGAAKVAAAWLIALGPIGLVIAAVAGVVFLIVKHWDTIKAKTVAVWGAVTGAVSGAVSAVIGFVKAHWPLLLAIITGPIGLAVLFIVKNWDKIKAATSAAFNFVKSTVSSVMSGIKTAVMTSIGAVITVFSGLLGKIKGALSGAGSALIGVGRNIVNGLISGIRSMGGAIGSALVALLPGPLKKFAGALGIASPSKVFEGFGLNIGEGLVQGVDKSRSDVTAASTRLAASVATPKGARFDAKASGTGRQGASAPTVDPIDYSRLAVELSKISIRNNLSIGKRDAATLVTVGTSAAGVLR